MYVIQIRHDEGEEWRTYHKYYRFYITAIFACIKAILSVRNIEARIVQRDPP